MLTKARSCMPEFGSRVTTRMNDKRSPNYQPPCFAWLSVEIEMCDNEG